jgi:hypothetical protein
MYIYAYTELHTYLTWEDLLKDNNFFLLKKKFRTRVLPCLHIYFFRGIFYLRTFNIKIFYFTWYIIYTMVTMVYIYICGYYIHVLFYKLGPYTHTFMHMWP